MKILISIIVYNNNLQIFEKLISSIIKQSIFNQNLSIKDCQIIIRDNNNGLQLRQVEEIITKYQLNQSSKIIASDNIGFAKGHNDNILNTANQKDQEYSYALITNPDGIFHHLAIENLLNFANSCDNRGIFEASQFPTPHPKTYCNNSKETKWCSGCCLLVPMSIFRKLNGFDDNFFMYMEDVDFSWRVRAEGFKCYNIDNALFSHQTDNKDRSLSKQTLLMWQSAYQLATKYQDDKFSNFALKKLARLMQDEDLKDFIKNLKSAKIDIPKYQSIVDFSHQFHFSEVRW
jgi:N-acetylglucosaminyl-diphospho-decaprenol L-rhamnosyltransferase